MEQVEPGYRENYLKAGEEGHRNVGPIDYYGEKGFDNTVMFFKNEEISRIGTTGSGDHYDPDLQNKHENE